ncbi:MAG: SRPBCC family protein [Pseudonocardia sp.]|nr:SRPBCC family protein [Pseudonocardia sp.]
MPEITLTARAAAPVEEVWKLLFDPSRFPEWWAGINTVQVESPNAYTLWMDNDPQFPMLLRTDTRAGRVTMSCQVNDIDFSWQLAETPTGTQITARASMPELEGGLLEYVREMVTSSLGALTTLAEAGTGRAPERSDELQR